MIEAIAPGLDIETIGTESGGETNILYAGTTTIATVELPDGSTGVGTARLAPSDHYVRKVGRGIALGRALASLGQNMEELWESRSVTKRALAKKRNR